MSDLDPEWQKQEIEGGRRTPFTNLQSFAKNLCVRVRGLPLPVWDLGFQNHGYQKPWTLLTFTKKPWALDPKPWAPGPMVFKVNFLLKRPKKIACGGLSKNSLKTPKKTHQRSLAVS